MKKVIALLIATVLSVGAVSPSLAADLVLVSGAVQTIDGAVIPNMLIQFSNKNTEEIFSGNKVDSKGKFALQIPAGNYRIYLSSGNPCITASFERNISTSASTIAVTLPRLKSYLFEFKDELGQLVPNVQLRGFPLQYLPPENVDISNATFSCGGFNLPLNTFRKSPVGEGLIFAGFESLDGYPSADQIDKATFSFLSGLGQNLTESLPLSGFVDGKFSHTIRDLPRVKITAKNFKISKNILTGYANFSEAPLFESQVLSRTFQTSIRVNRGGKWTNWIKVGRPVTPDKKGRVSVKVGVQFYKGTTIQVVVTGTNFTSSSQVAVVKVPK